MAKTLRVIDLPNDYFPHCCGRGVSIPSPGATASSRPISAFDSADACSLNKETDSRRFDSNLANGPDVHHPDSRSVSSNGLSHDSRVVRRQTGSKIALSSVRYVLVRGTERGIVSGLPCWGRSSFGVG